MSKRLDINWLGMCENCGSEEPKVVDTEKGDEVTLWDGDKVTCKQCGSVGEIEADGENAWVVWDEDYN